MIASLQLHKTMYTLCMSNSTLCLQCVEAVAMEMGGVLTEVVNASRVFKQMITVVSKTMHTNMQLKCYH